MNIGKRVALVVLWITCAIGYIITNMRGGNSDVYLTGIFIFCAAIILYKD